MCIFPIQSACLLQVSLIKYVKFVTLHALMVYEGVVIGLYLHVVLTPLKTKLKLFMLLHRAYRRII